MESVLRETKNLIFNPTNLLCCLLCLDWHRVSVCVRLFLIHPLFTLLFIRIYGCAIPLSSTVDSGPVLLITAVDYCSIIELSRTFHTTACALHFYSRGKTLRFTKIRKFLNKNEILILLIIKIKMVKFIFYNKIYSLIYKYFIFLLKFLNISIS